jgi:N6-adenosine-specific RNA methylase IME4
MLPFHPYADLFPLIEGEEFDALVADVKANDVREKIVVLGGVILDGRNRYRAALAAGLIEEEDGPDRTKYFERFLPEIDGDPLAFVVSKNLKRRHLDESQRAMIAARLATMRQGERTDLQPEPSANLPKVNQSDAARTLSISERALRHAHHVQDHGAPELIRAVDRGRLSVSAAEKASRLSVDVQRRIAAEAEAGNANAARSEIKKEARNTREIELANEQTALPNKRYGVIYADPEWRFEPYSRDSGMDRAADNHYPTSATEAICQRPIKDIAADDCVLFLWATVPMLPDALQVMAAWGFTYKSHCCWTKERVGTGYWFRNAHELLLVGTRGNIPAPAMGTQWPSTIEATVGKHSAKPERFYELIEEYFPNLPKIELNARRARPGWDAWGNEAPESFDPTTGEIDTPETGADRPPTSAGEPEPTAVNELCSAAAGSSGVDGHSDIPKFLLRPQPESIHG